MDESISIHPKNKMVGKGSNGEVYIYNETDVVKLFYPQFTEENVEEEFRNHTFVYEAGLPVPQAKGKIELNGRYGIIYEYIKGETLLDYLKNNPKNIEWAGQLMAELAHQIQQKVIVELPRQSIWRQALSRAVFNSLLLKAHTKNLIIRQLMELKDGDVVCHMDFLPNNIMLTANGPIVIDWRDAKAGNPLSAVANISCYLRVSEKKLYLKCGRRLNNSFLQRYMELSPFLRTDFDGWSIILAAYYLIKERTAEEKEKSLEFLSELNTIYYKY